MRGSSASATCQFPLLSLSHQDKPGVQSHWYRRASRGIFTSNNSTVPGGLTVSAWEAQVLGRLSTGTCWTRRPPP
jgi:hypothetical protein